MLAPAAGLSPNSCNDSCGASFFNVFFPCFNVSRPGVVQCTCRTNVCIKQQHDVKQLQVRRMQNYSYVHSPRSSNISTEIQSCTALYAAYMRDALTPWGSDTKPQGFSAQSAMLQQLASMLALFPHQQSAWAPTGKVPHLLQAQLACSKCTTVQCLTCGAHHWDESSADPIS